MKLFPSTLYILGSFPHPHNNIIQIIEDGHAFLDDWHPPLLPVPNGLRLDSKLVGKLIAVKYAATMQ